METASVRERSPLKVSPVGIAAVLLGLALVSWIVTVDRMRGMDAGPGADLGGLGWFLGIWVTMMAAMMLPSVAPMVLAYARVGRARPARTPTAVFASAYFAAWACYGIVAYGVFRLIDALDMGSLAWDEAGPWVAGGAIVAAGAYQLTPLKDVCLRHCRSPIHFLAHGWRDGARGAFRMGFTHGLYCVGCCWGLMLVLFTLGVMSLFWMALIASLIFTEKMLPRGDRLTRVIGVAFVALGMWIAVAPGSIPGLTEPGADMGPSMQMEP
jgi:predicted metal-binding membrane protein